MEIHQVVVSASPGDAVTDAAFGFRKLIRRVAPSEIFARFIDPRLADEVESLPALERHSQPGDLLLYHASIGEPEVVKFLLDRPSRLVLVYHNITPAKYFGEFDPAFAQLLSNGRVELRALRDRVELALAVSQYNAAELEQLGYRDVRVSPLPADFDHLAGLEPNAAVAQDLALHDGPLVLFVGQLLPHKRPDLLVAAFHVLSTYLLPEAKLALVGPCRLRRYHDALRKQATELGLRSCRIPGWQEPAALAAFYRAADVFVTVSEHEGVGVPLLESMRFGVPTIARAFGAIPETVAGAGLMLPTDDDPVLVAEAMAEVLGDEALRTALIARGRARVRQFPLARAEATFLAYLAAVA